MEIIVALICCDILGNWPYAIGYYPPTGSTLCNFAAFCNLCFLRATWLYSLAIVVNLRGLVFYRRAVMIKGRLHLFALGIPLILTLAMLSTNNYGKPESGNTVCSIEGNDNDAVLWHNVAYSGLLLICLAAMIGMIARLKYLEWIKSPLIAKDIYQMTFRQMLIYPILLGVCWLPHTILGFIKIKHHDSALEALGPIFDVFKILHGAAVAIGFYWTSKEFKLRWRRLFRSALGITGETSVLSSPLTSTMVEVIGDDFPTDENTEAILNSNSLRGGASANFDAVTADPNLNTEF